MPSIGSSADDFHQQSFRIKAENDDKLFSKLLARESTKSSFRVYYAELPSAVPFHWETRPGTPKHNSACISQIPPLTPPPSYFAAGRVGSSRSGSRSMLLLHSLMRRMNPKLRGPAAVSHSSSSSLSSLSWSSSSQHSSFSDPPPPPCARKRRRFSSWGSSFDARSSSDDRRECDSVRPSRLCYGIGGGERKAAARRGASSALVLKRALLSIVGRGSAA